MALSSGTLRLIIFILIFSIVFPILGYAFTNLVAPAYGNTIDTSLLINKGIFSSYVEQNVSRNSAWVTFDLGSGAGKYQIIWNSATGNFSITSYRSYGDTGYFWTYQNMWWYNKTSTIYDSQIEPENGTWTSYSVVADFNSLTNTTHTSARSGYFSWYGLIYIWNGPSQTSTAWDCDIIFKDTNPTRNNMTQCINEGVVDITIAKGFNVTSPSFWTFANWYTSTLISGNTFNLPSWFSWILDIFTILGVICAVLLTREFVPLLP